MALEVGADDKTRVALASFSIAGTGNAHGDGAGTSAEENDGSDSVGWRSREWLGESGGTQGLRIRPTLYHVRIVVNASPAACSCSLLQSWSSKRLIPDSRVASA